MESLLIQCFLPWVVVVQQTCAGSVREECRVLQDVWNNIIMRSPDNIVDSYRQGVQKVLSGNRFTFKKLLNFLQLFIFRKLLGHPATQTHYIYQHLKYS